MSNSFIDVKDILDEYSLEIQDAIAEEAINVSKKGVSKLKTTSPKRTGKYAKGWRVNTESLKGKVLCTIYNQNPGLTVLLEKPHTIRNKYGEWGTYTPKKEHIKPVEEECIIEYETNVENIIKNGV